MMSKIKWMGMLLTVSDVSKSRDFYERVIEQEVLSEYEGMVEFKNGMSLWSRDAYVKCVAGEGASKPTGAKLDLKNQPNNFQLYFEVEDLDCLISKVKSTDGIEIIHDAVEYFWGQRVFRFYDYDKHIVETSESLKIVVKRFLSQGLTIEEIAERMGTPVDFVKVHMPESHV